MTKMKAAAAEAVPSYSEYKLFIEQQVCSLALFLFGFFTLFALWNVMESQCGPREYV